MRFSAALVILAGVVASSSAVRLFARQYPTCAGPCIQNADIGTCDPSDTGCLCRDQGFISNTTQCIVTSCNPDDTKTAEGVAQQFCAAVGVTLSGTPTVAPSATGSGASASGSAAASGSPSGSGASSAKASNTAPASSGASGSVTTSPAPSATGNGATALGANAIMGLVAVGFAAFAL